MNTKMYVGNLPFSALESDIRTLFSDYGSVTEVFLPMDRMTNRPRGFAFVSMSSPGEMQEAIRGLNDKDFMGRNLAINEARPKEERPAYSGGGGGGGGYGERGGYSGNKSRGRY
ncbi:MAG: RNA-binding protein [Verrucomicrobiaceae bacterium]|jgi:cold-inducible RNA-binding protein|nr:RNA-binding protein [Verrucomicrobiaceae bacterium]